MKIIIKFQLKIVIFTAVKNCSILHGRVFVMTVIFAAIKTNSSLNRLVYFMYYMSRVMRKPIFCIWENKGTDQLHVNCTAISFFFSSFFYDSV